MFITYDMLNYRAAKKDPAGKNKVSKREFWPPQDKDNFFFREVFTEAHRETHFSTSTLILWVLNLGTEKTINHTRIMSDTSSKNAPAKNAPEAKEMMKQLTL